MTFHKILELFITGILIFHGQVLACDFASECSDGEICCNYQCVGDTDCYGYSCTSDAQCGETGSMTCCSRKCTYGSDCEGQPCFDSSSCSSAELCCDGYCQNFCDDNYYDDRWGITIIIVGSVFGAGILSCVCMIVCCLRRGARRRGQVIGNRRAVPTAATYGSTPYGNQTQPPQTHQFYSGMPPGNYPPYPPPQSGLANAGYEVQYPTTSSAPGQHPDAPPAYADVVHSPREMQGEAAIPQSQPSAPLF